MCDNSRRFNILMADDDAEDCMLLRDALGETGLLHDVESVADGEALLARLRRCEQDGSLPRPDLILLDLNMPRMDGREVLGAVRHDGRLGPCPIVVLTTSTSAEDVGFCYSMGASSYITKPATYSQWVDLAANLSRYWFETVELPRAK